MYWRQNCQVPRCCLCGFVRRTRLAGNGERAREYPGKMDIDKRLFSHNLTASGLFTTDFHLHEAMFSTRAGNITCRVGSRSKTSNGQLRHRCADDALSSGQPLDDATALDQQETPDTERASPHKHFAAWGFAAASRHQGDISGCLAILWMAWGGGDEKARG